ncbi:MAG: metal ABC transporter ATP-binding protein [Eubacteriales bacterium]
MDIIELRDVTVYYNNVCALEKINIKIKEKDFVGVIGPNGGGKSTLLKLLAGLITPSNGRIKKKKGLRIGYVPQFTSFDKNFPISVEEVILSGLLDRNIKIFKKYSNKNYKKLESITKFLKIEDLKKRQIGQLSGGQLQKVLIARALMSEPEVLLLDEPTSSIDSKTKENIYKLLNEINKEKTIIIISHDLLEVLDYAKKIVCVNKTLHYHGNNTEISNKTLEEAYGCPVEVVLHNRV